MILCSSAASGADLLRIIPTQVPLPNIAPFVITGFIQKATVDAMGDPFSGGTLTVNGTLVTIPRNTLFQMPALTLTWGELFTLAPAPYHGQSGLALNDSPTPPTTYEVTVMGNRIIHTATDDKYIAGLVFMSQQSVNATSGYINAIDYTAGELWVGSALGATRGARVRINDPIGRFGIAHSPDVRFTSDAQNPTIVAQTGFPMCIARKDPTLFEDPLCPQRNRPVDPITKAYQTTYTMPAPGTGLATDPDATQQTPFEVGDFITYFGTLVRDPSCLPTATDTCQYISAHTIIANLGIFTAPGAMPAYVRIDQMRLGVAGQPNPLFPQEATEKLRVVAYTTDPTQLIDVFAVDVDSCGTVSDRFYNTADPFGPPFAGVKGRAVFSTAFGNYMPATRELRVASRTFTNGFNVDIPLRTAKTYANGIIAGQFHAPNFNFIFPENLVVGSPAVPFPFQEFPFLASGSGTYTGAAVATQASLGHLGQLSPWPGLLAPAALGCGPAGVIQPPTANAGKPQTVVSGATVVLDGTLSFDPNAPPLPLSFTWVQQSDAAPAVALQDAGLSKAFFIAPAVKTATTFTFQLAVSNGFASSAVATVAVTVKPK
jgi:hypothetical protein